MTGPILQEGLPRLGLSPAPETVEKLERYCRLLLEKNQVMNLTAIREEDQAARLHLLDCAALAGLWDLRGKRLVDIGTGAGFPGMVLKLLEPSLDVTLLDSLNKRLEWLDEVCGALSLTGIRTLHARAEEAGRDPGLRDGFDIAASRAVAELRTLCELCLPCVKPGGVFLAMKSVECGQELREAGRALDVLAGTVEAVRDYAIPGTEIVHRLVVIRKTGPTPEGYPRPFAKIKKRPL